MSTTIKFDDITTIPQEYIPIIYDIKSSELKPQTIDASLAKSYAPPLLSLGFQQFLHADIVNIASMIKDFEGKKKVYTTIHLFNQTIDNYDSDLKSITKKYFNIGNDNIIGASFYKMWEILSLFNVIDINKSFESVQLLDTNGAFTQSIELFEKTFSKKISNQFHIVSHISSELDKYIKTNKKITKISLDSAKIDDNMTNTIIKKIQSSYKNSIDLVVGCGLIDTKYDILIEQKTIKTFIWEIWCMLNIIKTGGCFVCQIFETYTNVMFKLLFVLSQFFDEIYITKPLLSHESTSEKFVVCKHFSPKPKLTEQIKDLFDILSKSDLNVIDIFPDLDIPDEFRFLILASNIDMSNRQLLGINKIVTFIKSQNYFGDMYNESKQQQINASSYWENVYYPKVGKSQAKRDLNKNILSNIFKKSVELSKSYYDDLSKKL